jgi:RNA polymerase sigma factor (sigma-70 family)
MEAHALPRPRVPAGRLPVHHALLSDERLAQLVATGDQRAFAMLYERYHQPLYRYCRSMLRHDADAQDALQSTLAGAFAALKRGQRDAPVRPWLFRIAHNESISVLRRQRPQVELSEGLEQAMASLEEQSEARERLKLLVADLLDLPERQRGALVMRELSGLSHEDIAVAFGTSVGAAKQAIFEARRALAEFAEGREMDCNEVCRLVSDADGRVLRGRRVRAHLRECAACSAFADAIPERTAELRALTPALPAVAAGGMLAQILGGGWAGGVGGSIAVGGGAGGLAGILSGKTAVLGVAAKVLGGLAVVSAATVGITTAVEQQSPTHHPTIASPHHAVRGSAQAARTHGTTVSSFATGPVAGRSGGRQHGQAVSTAAGIVGAVHRSTDGPTVSPPGHSIEPGVSNASSAAHAGTPASSNASSTAGTVPGQTIRTTKGQSSRSQSSSSQSAYGQSQQPLRWQSRAPTVTVPLGLLRKGI